MNQLVIRCNSLLRGRGREIDASLALAGSSMWSALGCRSLFSRRRCTTHSEMDPALNPAPHNRGPTGPDARSCGPQGTPPVTDEGNNEDLRSWSNVEGAVREAAVCEAARSCGPSGRRADFLELLPRDGDVAPKDKFRDDQDSEDDLDPDTANWGPTNCKRMVRARLRLIQRRQAEALHRNARSPEPLTPTLCGAGGDSLGGLKGLLGPPRGNTPCIGPVAVDRDDQPWQRVDQMPAVAGQHDTQLQVTSSVAEGRWQPSEPAVAGRMFFFRVWCQLPKFVRPLQGHAHEVQRHDEMKALWPWRHLSKGLKMALTLRQLVAGR